MDTWILRVLTEHDEQLHQVVIDGATSGLDDEDILVTDRVANLDVGLLVGELCQLNLAGGDTEAGTDLVNQSRVRATCSGWSEAEAVSISTKEERQWRERGVKKERQTSEKEDSQAKTHLFFPLSIYCLVWLNPEAGEGEMGYVSRGMLPFQGGVTQKKDYAPWAGGQTTE
jgi:hypothetical protein